MRKSVCFCYVACFALIVALALFCFPAAAQEEGQRCRALLVACDEFLSATQTGQVGLNNLLLMEAVLKQDARGFDVYRQYSIITSKEALAAAIAWSFADAREGDVSLLYLCTHGEFEAEWNNPEGVLLLSDGYLEDRVTAQELSAMLDAVPGTKVLIVDACNSGALVGKGVSPDVGQARVARTFQSDGYKVLASSGASEPSWYWLTLQANAPPGSAHFTTALALGAGYLGDYTADSNRDGVITLKEAYDYLWTNQASSVVQMFPQDDSFPLFVYDRGRVITGGRGALGDFVFPGTSLDPQNPLLTFSYTVLEPARVAYRVTYLSDGQWDWHNSVILPDRTEYDGDMDPMGDVSPGRKQVSLDLSPYLPEGWTYAMVHVMTVGDYSPDSLPFVYTSRVLSARQAGGPADLSVSASPAWQRRYHRELEVFVRHATPCTLTVIVEDEEGKMVRRLCVSRPTRPQALSPSGSLLYWNGLDEVGVPVPAGRYRLAVSARAGGETATAEAWVEVE